MHANATIRRAIPMYLLNESGRVPMAPVMRYDTARAFSVVIEFSDTNLWVLDRDLLALGLRGLAATEEFRITPDPTDPHYVMFELNGTSKALLRVFASFVAEFLDDTYAKVPSGTELDFVDFDAALKALI